MIERHFTRFLVAPSLVFNHALRQALVAEDEAVPNQGVKIKGSKIKGSELLKLSLGKFTVPLPEKQIRRSKSEKQIKGSELLKLSLGKFTVPLPEALTLSVSAMRRPIEAPMQCALNLAAESVITENGTSLCRTADRIEFPIVDVVRKQGAVGRASRFRVVAELLIERMR